VVATVGLVEAGTVASREEEVMEEVLVVVMVILVGMEMEEAVLEIAAQAPEEQKQRQCRVE